MSLDIKGKLFAPSEDEVRSIDTHPTEPWLLAGLYKSNTDDRGTINIINLDSGAIIHSFQLKYVRVTRITWQPYIHVLCVKFIARMDWFAVSTSDGVLYVFNSNTYKIVRTFKAHKGYARCLVVHPTAPIILTGGDDMTINAWDWDQQWRRIHKYKGHKNWITYIAYHPKDSNVFVSASIDGIVKVWSTASPIAEATIKAHNSPITSIEFFPDKPYLITASNDSTMKILDYKTETCIQTMQAVAHGVTFVVFHPNLSLIIGGSVDGTVKFWNSETYKIESTLSLKLGRAICIAFRKETNQVAVGFDEGVSIFELEYREPEPSMDSLRNSLISANLQTPDMSTITSSLSRAGISLEATNDDSAEVVSRESGEAHQRDAELYRQCTILAIELMKSKSANKLIYGLTDNKAQDMVDFLSKMVDDEDTFTHRERKHTLYLLSKLAKSAQVFPQSLELEGVQCNLTTPVAAGGYGFIYKAVHDGSSICIKVVQADSEGIDRKKMRAQASELIIWAHIFHPNVLPFLGIYPSEEEVPRICIVSPWMKHGDLLQYLKNVPDVPRKPLVRDVIIGLQYMHDFDIIHADLKAKNVLVSETGRAMLADFGVSRLSMTHTMTSTNASAGTAYWMAPELLSGNDEVPSRESDVWAFACTCYEVITGMVPFNQYRNAPILIGAFLKGKIVPSKPEPGIGWDEDVWSVAEQCWKSDPASRPKAHELLDMIDSFNFRDDRSSEPQSQRRRRSFNIDYERISSILDEVRQSCAV